MPEIKTEESWIPWSVKQPENPGMYWWRLQSAVLPELTLIFAASLKTCNGVTVPPFYHWNEWKAVVPPCEWKPAPEVPVSSHGEYSLSIENLEFQRCPFCGKIPTLNGYRWAADGGVIITASPQDYNCWWLQCCEWAGSPKYEDPRELERIRREAFARVKETSCPKN